MYREKQTSLLNLNISINPSLLALDLCLSIQYSNVPFKDTISTGKEDTY